MKTSLALPDPPRPRTQDAWPAPAPSEAEEASHAHGWRRLAIGLLHIVLFAVGLVVLLVGFVASALVRLARGMRSHIRRRR
ncbi:hypothetical protein N8K70_16020 [Microbacterium betulae]|uniref:Uncharacterized protein n=1 Tax=Microbacterium betulae TaxID=2981139 RepID=A0AA97FHW7_9MICO|nr:hypothetical protein [Microbacterium sp. AB]WOF22879.1 hypothetical protein N8K70_16020 [Microbacterium sp. AB]